MTHEQGLWIFCLVNIQYRPNIFKIRCFSTTLNNIFSDKTKFSVRTLYSFFAVSGKNCINIILFFCTKIYDFLKEVFQKFKKNVDL